MVSLDGAQFSSDTLWILTSFLRLGSRQCLTVGYVHRVVMLTGWLGELLCCPGNGWAMT